MRIDVEYSLTCEDFLAFQRAHRKSMKGLMRWMWPVGLLWTVTGVCLALQLVPGSNGPAFGTRAFWIQAIECAIFWVVLNLVLMAINRWLHRRAYRGSPHLWNFRRVSISEEGVGVESTSFTAAYKWNHFRQMTESKRLFLLYESTRSAQIIPKRAFESEEKMHQFRDMVRSRVGQRTGGFPVEVMRGEGV